MKKWIAFCLCMAMGWCMLFPMGAFAEAGNIPEGTTLRVIATTHTLTKDLETLPMFQALEERTGVTVEWEQVRSGWDEKKSTILASGDLPDVFIGGAITSSDISMFNSFFLPLEDMIPTYAPNIQKMFDEMPLTKTLSTFGDGHVYAPASIVPLRPKSICQLMINKVWLNKLGLETPTTLDELYDVLVAFRDNDPNGNGIKDEIPFDFQNGRGGAFNGVYMLSAWGITESGFGEYVYIEDGQVKFLPSAPAYKELVAFYHKLYSEGLLNKEVFTQNYSQFQAKAWNPEIPLVGCTLGWSPDNRVGPVWAEQYLTIPPLRAAGYEGKTPWVYSYDRLMITTNNAVITTACKSPEAAVMWLNEFYGEDMSVEGYFGSIGDCVSKSEDGIYTVLPPQDESLDSEAWAWSNCLVNNSPMYASEVLQTRIVPPEPLQVRLEGDKVYDPYRANPEEVYPMVVYEGSDLDELSLLWGDLFSYTEQKWAEWISKGNFDSEWEGYLAQLENIGLARMLEIMQKYYDKAYK